MILILDNYDSFTYNIYQYLSELGANALVVRNDQVSIDDLREMKPEKIVVSPGPRTPDKAGISNEVIRYFGSHIPTLGVCLGHQCVGHAYGGTVASAGEIMHGKTSLVHHDGKGVFDGIPSPFEAIRYHSLSIHRDGFPDELEISAWTEDGVIMGVRHKTHPVEGIQFHPESIMTKYGKDILNNFINM